MNGKEISFEDKTELLIAVKNYKLENKEKWPGGTDFVVSNLTSEEKVLMRLISPRNKLGFVGANDVKSMLKAMKRKDCDHGIIIGKRFTDAAIKEMNVGNIQQISDDYMPPLTLENILFTINNAVDNLCKVKCGAIPLKESDCKNHLKDSHCRIRSISNNALFHFEHGWSNLLKNDLRQLLLLNKSH